MYILKLAKQLKRAAKVGDVAKCTKIAESITRVMETYKRSC